MEMMNIGRDGWWEEYGAKHFRKMFPDRRWSLTRRFQ